MSISQENMKLFHDDSEIEIWIPENWDINYAPKPCSKLRDWMDKDIKTNDHAKFCQPLTMACSLGFYVPSPVEATIKWNGDENTDAEFELHDKASHGRISNHSSCGSFTIQSEFVVRSKNQGDFIMVTGFMNEVRQPFNFLSACIEGWWNVANFGMVGFINQPGEFRIKLGQPLVQMYLLKATGANADLRIIRGTHPYATEFTCKRDRTGDYEGWDSRCPVKQYHGKDLDYLNGRWPDLTEVPGHVKSWQRQVIFPDFEGKSQE